MDTTRDLLVARLATERGLVARAGIEDCLRLQGQAARIGLPMPLLVILERKGHLTAEQAAELDRAALEQAHTGTQVGTIADTGRAATADSPAAPAPFAPARSDGAAGGDAAGGDDGPTRSALAEPAANFAGRNRIGHYRIVREIGRGAMGVVYEARQENPPRPVALKLVNGESLGTKAITRFRREAEAVGRLNHPNIVRIYEAGEEDSIPYLAMELIEGRGLEREIASGRIPVRRAVGLFVQAADAIHYAHGEGIIHRDLKPANLMIGPNDRVILTDFGLARDLAAATLTASGAIMGTPMYMPPEQAEGKVNELDARSDVYALGASLYETLTGNPIFAGDTVGTVLHKVLTEEPRALRGLVPDLPREVEWIVLKALRKEKERRYQTAAELRDDLKRFLDGGIVQARPTSIVHRAVRTVRRNRVATAALTAAALAISLGGAAYAHRVARQELREGALQGAEGQVRSGNVEEALRLLAALVEADPGFARGRLEQGRVLGRLGRRADARDAFARTVELDRGSAEAWTELGIAERRLGREAEALAAFERALSLQASYALARVERGTAALDAGRVEAAAGDFESVRAGAAPEAMRARAECGLGEIARARGDLEAARRHFDAAHAYAPDDPSPFVGRGECAAAERDFDAADAEFARAAERSPGDARILLLRAQAALRQGEPPRALAHLDAAQKLSRTDGEAAILRAAAVPEDHVAAALDACLEADPGHRAARSLRAIRRMDQGDAAGAEADAAALGGGDAAWLRARAGLAGGGGAPAFTGDGAEAALVRARLAAKAGDLTLARECAEAAVARPSASLGFTLWEDARALYGKTQRLEGMRDDAHARRDLRRVVALCDRAVRLVPDLGAAWWLRAQALFESGRWREAFASADRAVEIHPCLAEALGWRAFFRITLDKFAALHAAKKDLEAAVALEPANPRWILFRAILRIEEKDLAGAREDAARAYEIGPKYAAALRLIRELQSMQGQNPGSAARRDWQSIPGDRAVSRFLEYAGAAALREKSIQDAVDLYQHAIREDPTNAEALLDLGTLLQNFSRNPLQAAYLQFQAAELHPDFAFRSYFELMPTVKQMDKAGFLNATTATAFLSQIPPGPARDIMTGFLHYSLGKHEKAVQFFGKAIEADPQAMVARCFRSAALALLGRVDEARADASDALARAPDSALPHYFLACVEAVADHKAVALEHLSRCLEIDIPGLPEAIRDEPFFQGLRDSQEFNDLLAR